MDVETVDLSYVDTKNIKGTVQLGFSVQLLSSNNCTRSQDMAKSDFKFYQISWCYSYSKYSIGNRLSLTVYSQNFAYFNLCFVILLKSF
jgi:hypothetical protein